MNLQTVRTSRQTVFSSSPLRDRQPTAGLPHPNILLLATVALWTVAYVGWTAGWMIGPLSFSLERALRRIILCICGGLLCLLIGVLLEHIRGRSVLRTVGGAVTLVLLATVVHAFISEAVYYAAVPREDGSILLHIAKVMTDDVWLYVAWVMLYFTLAADAARRDRETQLAQASAQAMDARHRLLVQQINPHFLFNALNTVYASVLGHDEQRATQSLLALSAFLRRSLEAEAVSHVPLRDELESVHDYLRIETARFGERLTLVQLVPTALFEREVPNLILQPLIENVVKHGLRHYDGAVVVTVTAAIQDGSLTLTVENDGPTAAPAKTHGVGLDNIAQRLRLLYGEAGGLDTHPRTGGGFVARIRLPAGA